MNESQIKLNHDLIKKNKIKIRKLYQKSLRRFRKYWFTGCLITRLKPRDHFWLKKNLLANFAEPSYLYGQPYVLKDNVSTKNILTTCGSAFLKKYFPPFNATIYDLLSGVGCILVGKANMDEFAMGGTGTFSAYGVVHNPHLYDNIAGGSSSGSAVAVAIDAVPFSIGNDTGDSVRKPASYVGVVGYKPSYGFISRYGILPYAPSLDHIGIFTKYVTDASIVAQTIVRYDEKDFTSVKAPIPFKDTLNYKSQLKLGYLGCLEALMPFNVYSEWKMFKKLCKEKGINLVRLSVNYDYLRSVSSVYRIISYAEAASCYASFTGLTFGQHLNGFSFDDLAVKTRTKFFGQQVKRRFIIGSFATSSQNFEKLFLKSKQVRRLIVNDYLQYLPPIDSKNSPTVDAIVSLGASNVAPTIISIKSDNSGVTNLIDDYLQIANFSGMPSITIPFTTISRLPLGLNFMAGWGRDVELLDVAYTFEKIFSARRK